MLAIFAKAYGLFIFIGLSVAVIAYAYWPANRERFRKAAKAVLDEGEEDKPWR
ncbi:cbb3-type cytochrome c oxidase subunit 3 [Rhodoblastus sp.]|jgi:cytochrome c oxidase cbb3-type subunit 4|uniref:cbb3-type cytochrome c oxidase subunit 3 n=1 Tax=Rhodoblastus sp. TaxID=1962975 RepID=UPI0025D845D5|nr:cbb3-type cytochrome c oxidase subunit 3 [Rhodoblastus sp.]